MTPTKVCKHCIPTPRTLPATSEYFSVRRRSRDGLASKCKDCERRDHQDYYARKKKDARRREVHKKSNLKRLYNLTVEQYNEMYEAQGGACAICLRAGIRLDVDHDHATGEVRGLLCDACNHGLGRFRDNIMILISAQRYLEVHNARSNTRALERERKELRGSPLSDGPGLGSIEEALGGATS